jgi:hypothetical protein
MCLIGPERPGLGRIDHRPHPQVEGLRAVHTLRSALPALGRMLRGPAFGRVHRGASEERLARAGQVACLGEGGKPLQQRLVEMRFGVVEADPGFLNDERDSRSGSAWNSSVRVDPNVLPKPPNRSHVTFPFRGPGYLGSARGKA